MAVSQILFIFGLGLESKVFCRKNNGMIEIMNKISAQIGADSLAKYTHNSLKFIQPIFPIGPKVGDIGKKGFIGRP